MIRALGIAALFLLVGCLDNRRVRTPDGEVPSPDSGPAADAGPGRDAGPGLDAGLRDAGRDVRDTGPRDAGPITIADVQRGLVPEGTFVSFSGVVVTATRSDAIWVQDPSLGAMYSGVRVYVGGPPGVFRDDLVSVSGTVVEYFGDTEIDLASVTWLGVAAPIAPVSLTVAQAATEPYEGVLVRLTDATSFVYGWDCTLDDPACSDSTSLWQINGAIGVLVSDYCYEDVDFFLRQGEVPVTGVMMWRYNRRRIMPRISADFGL